MKNTISAAMIVAALALTSACGGGGDDRPSKADVKTAITKKDSVFGSAIPKAAADCVAGVLVDSKVSDKALTAIVEGDKKFKGSKSDEEALRGLSSKFGTCVTK
ncbi:MAG: hypothetical protein JWR27_686 [Aeromicrobium sp.]|nr:hypothetical protein [Aeromicrobium sp.]